LKIGRFFSQQPLQLPPHDSTFRRRVHGQIHFINIIIRHQDVNDTSILYLMASPPPTPIWLFYLQVLSVRVVENIYKYMYCNIILSGGLLDVS
jgi:hypothetical protein